MFLKLYRSRSVFLRRMFSSRSCRCSMAFLTASRISSFLNGLVMKSKAPSLVALTAFSIEANAVRMTVTGALSSLLNSSRTFRPSMSGSIRSSRTALYSLSRTISRAWAARLCQVDLVFLGAEERRQDVAHDLLVVDNQDSSVVVHLVGGCRVGSLSLKRVPLPGSLSTRILPPCSWIIP